MVDYDALIKKYIEPGSQLYDIYVRHVTQVTEKAIELGAERKLSDEKMRFIEEAAMLHDIGIVKVNCPIICCYGDSPYFHHHFIGRELLLEEGLPDHAEVAARHFTPGVTEADVCKLGLPAPFDGYFPITDEQILIAYADLFSTKDPSENGNMRTIDEVMCRVGKYGDGVVDAVYELSIDFGDVLVSELR